MRINTPKHVALYSALVSSLLVGIVVGVLTFNASNVFITVVASVALSFGVVYGIVYYLIERFLYGKIKLIYKNILSLKTTKNNDIKINMGEDVLATVSSEVENWTDVKTKEIQRLKAQEAFRREFIGNVAHELKTPVFSIQGYILTLLEGGLEDPNVNQDFLLRAAKGVDRMTHIIEDLDMITKFESGNIPLNIQKHSLFDLAQEIIDGAEYKANDRNVIVKFAEDYDKPYNVKMDRARIGQVLTNLVNNAINYAKPEGGKVEIRFYQMNDRLLVEVADDGIGIDEEHLPRLFERFYRVDRSRSRDMGGTGLGLAIAKHIIEAHKSTIDVRSTVGVGSTFSFTLPLT